MLISSSVQVAANAVSGNVLAGELFEFLPVTAAVSVFATGSAAGLRATFTLGGVTQVSDGLIPATNRYPVRPDDGLVSVGGVAGERLFLEFRNTTGGALVAQWVIDIDV